MSLTGTAPDTQPETSKPETTQPETRLVETRTFAPNPALAGTWNVDARTHETASADPIAFWE
ncbi:MAG: hypothetical protein L0J84_15695, partial [Brachybacterium sp.]|nr:hypothetical protein [Brachybacterium sp.]